MKTLGIDIGTTSICAVGWVEGQESLAWTESISNEFLPECWEQDADVIIRKVRGLLERAKKAGFGPDQADAVGISSQMHGIVYTDREGKAVSPLYTWKDERGNEKCTGCEDSYARVLSEKTGYSLFSGYGMVTHYCLKEKGKIPADAIKLAGIGDYLAMCLTGRKEPVIDSSMAASFGGYDLERGEFDRQALEKAGVDVSFLPRIEKAGKPVGICEGVPVYCAIGDNQASFYGALRHPEDQVSVNVGTGSQVSVFGSRLQTVGGADVRPFFDRGYLYVGASLNGGKVYERLADFFKETVYAFTGMRLIAYDMMEKLGEEAADTALEVNPLLYGSRSGGREGGSVSGLTFDNLHPGDLIRAYVRGMAEELHRMYQGFPEELRRDRKEIVASGNGIRLNRLLAREVEARFGMPVRFGQIREEAAAGAAMYAARRTGGK